MDHISVMLGFTEDTCCEPTQPQNVNPDFQKGSPHNSTQEEIDPTMQDIIRRRKKGEDSV